MTNRIYKFLLLGGLPVLMSILDACSYASKKIDFPIDFKYASVSIEFDGVADSLKTEVGDSIFSSLRRADFIITNADRLNENQCDSLLLIQVLLIKRGAEFAVSMSFYPYRGNVFREIYLSEVINEDRIAIITAKSGVPFAENYNRRKAFEILNNGLITKGGIRQVFNSV